LDLRPLFSRLTQHQGICPDGTNPSLFKCPAFRTAQHLLNGFRISRNIGRGKRSKVFAWFKPILYWSPPHSVWKNTLCVFVLGGKSRRQPQCNNPWAGVTLGLLGCAFCRDDKSGKKDKAQLIVFTCKEIGLIMSNYRELLNFPNFF